MDSSQSRATYRPLQDDPTIAARMAGRLGRDTCAIYLFHGVVPRHENVVRNYKRKHLSAAEFRAILQKLSETGVPLSMDDVLAHGRENRPYPAGAFAITFDDGFENNGSVAAPILREFGIPATFYLTTQFLSENAMSWIDKIEAAVAPLKSGRLAMPWLPAELPLNSADEKIAALDLIRQHVKNDRNLKPATVVTEICTALGVEEPVAGQGPLDLKLDYDQVKTMAADPLFIFGGHTHTHAIMSFLDDAELEREIDVSIDLLKQRAAVQSHHYAYPEGLAHCYDGRVIAALQRRGIAICPTAIDGVAAASDHPFHLKRIMAA